MNDYRNALIIGTIVALTFCGCIRSVHVFGVANKEFVPSSRRSYFATSIAYLRIEVSAAVINRGRLDVDFVFKNNGLEMIEFTPRSFSAIRNDTILTVRRFLSSDRKDDIDAVISIRSGKKRWVSFGMAFDKNIAFEEQDFRVFPGDIVISATGDTLKLDTILFVNLH